MTQETNWLAWKNYIFTASHILAGAETQLQSTYGISLSDFDVLVSVYEAPEHTINMNSLKDSVLVTTSGLSRAVTRLKQRGWLEKESCQTDKRQVTLKLTNAGRDAFKEIGPAHRKHIRKIFFDALSNKDQEALVLALGHLRDHLKVS